MLVIVGGLQALILKRQTGIIGGSLKVSKDSLVELKEYVSLTRQLAESAKTSSDLATQALHLTERADVLVDAVSISNRSKFEGDSIVCIIFKNFGRTRANRAEGRGRLFIAELEPKDAAPTDLFAAVIGAGDTHSVGFHPLHEWLTEETFTEIIKGQLTMRFDVAITYWDVFDKPHRTRSSGAFMPETRQFRIDANQEAD